MLSVWGVVLFLVIEEDRFIVNPHSTRSSSPIVLYEKKVMKDFVTTTGSQERPSSDTKNSYVDDGKVSIDRLLDALHLVK